MSDKCPTCDRPKWTCPRGPDGMDIAASRAFYRAQTDAAVERNECGAAGFCHDFRVDWRARALAAEARMDEMERKA